MMIDRRFVRVAGQQFQRGRARYPVVGANMWYAAYLGADRPYGDRARLGREFDRLLALGVNNVRLLGASERSPLKGALSPTSGNGRAAWPLTLPT